MSSKSRFFSTFSGSLIALRSEALWACTVCFGQADPQTVDALNKGVLFMIGCVAFVLAGLTIMVVRVVRKQGNSS